MLSIPSARFASPASRVASPFRTCTCAALVALGAVLVASVVTPARAGTTVYTNRALFQAALQPGFYAENFSTLTPDVALPGPISFTGPNGFSFTAEELFTPGTPALQFGNLYGIDTPNPGGRALSTESTFNDLLLTMTGAPVTAFGGDFYLSFFDGTVEPGPLSLILNDGTQVDLNFAMGSPIPFVGFITDGGTTITSLRMRNPYAFVPPPGFQPQSFNTADDLLVGRAIVPAATAAPEPGSLALLALAGVPAAAGRRLRRKLYRRGQS
ncbi:MAG: hypothetical protein V4671_22250 [Armatimonadota bacterium]